MADKKISALTGATTPLTGTEVLPIVQSGATVKVAVSDLTAGRAMAASSLTTATVQATNSGGLALKNSGGTTQLSLGAGGGDNITLSVATNITPANAAVAISPTGTGTVTINPAAASAMNNVAIGGTTALAGSFTTITATAGNVVIGTSGQGVDFSATPGTGTSELLADYEEGTWTPAFGVISGSATYTTQNGTYTKVGRQVTAIFYIQVDTSTLLVTQNITGLPFTSSATSLYSGVSFSVYTGAFSGQSNVLGLMLPNNTSFQLRVTSSAIVAPVLTSINITNGTEIAGTVTYFV
jgi:hypothetical protein